MRTIANSNELPQAEQDILDREAVAVRQELHKRWERNMPKKDHTEDAFFFQGIDNDGRLDSSENPEKMSITIKYFESIEEAEKGNIKELRLWAFKEDAEKYAMGIIEATKNHTLPPGW